jgi:protein-disulfide isomerase
VAKPTKQTSKNGGTARSATTSRAGRQAGPRSIWIIAGVAAAILVVIFFASRGGGGGSAATQPVASVEMDPASLQTAQGIEIGSPTAPVQLHEYADFQCPACQQFSTFIHPLIKERLVDQGLVRMVRYDFPLINIHPHAFLAARAARCANDQGKFWEYHDVLYARQPTWSVQRSALTTFIEYAETVGLDAGQFGTCLRSDQHAEEVTRNLRLGEALGVTGTPSFLINGQRASFGSYQELEDRVFQMAGRTPPTEATSQ